MDAIDARDWDGLADELGDSLVPAVVFAQMASEEGRFDIADSLLAINSKLVRRHPHVFADGDAKTSGDVLRRWDEIKVTEKESKGAPPPKGLLAGVPCSLPALVEAQKIAATAAPAPVSTGTTSSRSSTSCVKNWPRSMSLLAPPAAPRKSRTKSATSYSS